VSRASQRRVTARQHEVLELIADGLTDKEIAARLGIRYRTVRSHVDALEAIFGVTTRAGLIGRWLRVGTPEPPPV
jgi:DNA-binding CsgD family transcriptional regulator